MKDSPILLLFLIIYLIAASSGSKKKGKQKGKQKKKPLLRAEEGRRRGPMRTQAQGEQADWRSILQTQQVHQGFSEAFDRHDSLGGACENQPIHLHEVAQAQMAKAAEGEDPCHVGGRDQHAEPDEGFAVWQDEAQTALAQDVLRGVVMSEILTRPHERAALGAAKRRYHG